MNIKIIEPITHPTKEFNNADEFNIWYSKNKDSVNSFTTHKLNKMYKIAGYRITKIKGELMLKKNKEQEDEMDYELEIEQLKKDLNKTQNEVK